MINATNFKTLDLKKVIERANEILCCLPLLDPHVAYGLEIAEGRLTGQDIVSRHEPLDLWEKLAWQMVYAELREQCIRDGDPSVEKRPVNWNGGLT